MSTIYNGWRKWDFENRNHDKLHDQNDERATFNHDVLFLPLHWIGEIRGWQDFTVTRPSWFIKDLTVRDAEALKIEAFLGLAIRMARDIAFLSLARTARIAPRLARSSLLRRCNCTRSQTSMSARCVPSSRLFHHQIPPERDARLLSRRQLHARPFTDARAIVRVCLRSLANATRWSSGLLVFLCRSRRKSSIGRPSTWRQQRNYFFHFSFAASERASANRIPRVIFTTDSIINEFKQSIWINSIFLTQVLSPSNLKLNLLKIDREILSLYRVK